jgi:hypothetical protein
MQQSKPDVPSLEERVALLERQSDLKRQAVEYLTQLRLTTLTFEYEVGEGGAAELKSDCEADRTSIGNSSDDPSADEFDPDSIPPSSAPAEERHKPVFRRKLRFHLPDYDAREPHVAPFFELLNGV